MEVLNNIGFDWQIALANFINFLIIFWILKKWVFGPVKNIIKKRKKEIQKGIDKAKQMEHELAQAQEKTKQEIKVTKEQANEIVKKAQEQADNRLEEAKVRAIKEAEYILKKAHDQIKKDTKKAQRDLSEKTASLIALGVQKILDEDLNEEKHDALSKRAMSLLENK